MVGVDEQRHRTRVKVRRRVRSRRHRRRRRRAVILAVLGVSGLIGLLALISALGVRSRLTEGRTALLEGRAAIAAADTAGAVGAFARAESAFIRARGQARNPVLRVLGMLPLVGRTPDTVAAIADAGLNVAMAGSTVAGSVESLPAGPATLAPQNGAIDLEPLATVAPSLARGRVLLDEAHRILQDSPSWLLLGPVDRARGELSAEVRDARRVLTAGAELSEGLPTFLGAGQERRYFVGAANPAELRGTGGFLGAYAILTVRDGRIDLGPFTPIEELPSVGLERVEPPNPDYASRYDEFGGAGFWQNINMTPDFPSAATAIEALYEEVTGDPVDGAIVADPFGLAELLEATGPAEAPRGGTVDASTVVPYVTNEAYAEITNPGERKRLLGEVAGSVMTRFLEGGVDPAAAGQALVDAGAGGHLLLHSTDPAVQSSFRQAGLDGALATSGDLLAVVVNNAAGNKIDYFLDERITYDIELGAEGSGIATSSATFTNESPTRGQPAYVIGPYDEAFAAGENVSYVSTYCAQSCLLDGFRRDGARDEVGAEVELGHPVYPTVVRLTSGATQELAYSFSVRRAWDGDDQSGHYRLTLLGQTTIRPTQVHLSVRVPEGMEIAETSPGMEAGDGRAIWNGAAEGRMTFDVWFERPALSRAWSAVRELLGRPVFGLADLGER